MLFETATIEWLNAAIALGRNAPHAEFVMMTPEVAERILASNPENRPLKAAVKSITEDIRAGRWTFNGESVIISVDGELNDGQHRLVAISEASIPVPMTVIFGVPRIARFSVDQGKVRTVGDYLGMEGFKHSSLLASIARLIICYEAGDGSALSAHHSTSKGKVRERVLADKDMIRAAEFAGSSANRMTGIVTPTVIGSCFYLFDKIDATDAKHFLRQVITGEDLRQGDPAFAVRKALIGLRTSSQPAAIEIIMRGWSAYRRRATLQIAKYLGQFPPLI